MKQIGDFLKAIWFPLIFLLILIVSFLAAGGVSAQRDLIGAFSGALVGVILGFIAEMIREGIKDFQRKNKDTKIYLRLLEEDAKSAHHSIWLYTRLIADPQVPENIKNHIPAEFDLRYWRQLSKSADFLRMGSENPFDAIFRIMWNLEEINKQIVKAKTGDPQAFQFAHAFYKMTIEDHQTIELLKNFMDEIKIKNLEDSWLKKSKSKT